MLTLATPSFRKIIQVFSTAEGLLTQVEKDTPDGLREVFETNVFGHFVLVRSCRLCTAASGSWTL